MPTNAIPPSSHEYNKHIAQQQPAQAGHLQGVKKANEAVKTGGIEMKPQSKGTSGTGAVRSDVPPQLTPPTGSISQADQIAALKTLADVIANTPRVSASFSQMETLMNTHSNVDPQLALLCVQKLKEEHPEMMVSSMNEGMAQCFNPDGTLKPEVEAALNGKMGKMMTGEGIPSDIQAELTQRKATGKPVGPPSQNLNAYIDACLASGIGGNERLSPVFMLMLLITEYNSMRSVMDTKIAELKQNLIKAGFDAQIADMYAKAYVAFGMAAATAAATGASTLAQWKASGKGMDESTKTQLEDTQKGIKTTEAEIKTTENSLKQNNEKIDLLKEIKKDPDSLSVHDKKLEADLNLEKLEKLKKLDEIEEKLQTPEDLKKYGSEVPGELRDPNGAIDQAKFVKEKYALAEKLKKDFPDIQDESGAINGTQLENAIDEVKAEQKFINGATGKSPEDIQTEIDGLKSENAKTKQRLGELNGDLTRQKQTMSTIQSTYMSGHTHSIQEIQTVTHAVNQVISGLSQFLMSMIEARIKGFEYEVVRAQYDQKNVQTDESNANQSLASLLKQAEEIAQAVAQGMSGVARNI